MMRLKARLKEVSESSPRRLAHKLAGGQKDTDGTTINSEWVPAQTRFLLRGEDITADTLGNTAKPDRLKFSGKLRTLFIGEDSSQHVNNLLWAYNVDTQKLSRLMSVPAVGYLTGVPLAS